MASGLERPELRALYERYAPLIHRRAFRLVGREAEAWDVVQEVFRMLLEKADSFRGEAQPMTFIYRITTNVALNALRHRTLREGPGPVTDDPGFEPGDVEARNLLAALGRSLDEQSLQIAALHFVDGLTQDDIGEVVGLSRKTVGKKLDSVRQQARALSGGAA